MLTASSLTRDAREDSVLSQTARDAPPVAAVPGNPIIGQRALADRVSPLAQVPRHQGGILAELKEAMGQFR
jgi:hypothetical protein